MNSQDQINYNRIAAAIDYIKTHFREQPNLDEVAAQVHLSPFHFQRLFTEWAGVSPKKFLQYISIDHAKKILKQQRSSLSDTAFETGLSGTGRLHDLFIRIEGMTPGEFKNGGADLVIRYSYFQTPFGNMLVASTTKGICLMTFADNDGLALEQLQQQFPNAQLSEKADPLHLAAVQVFQSGNQAINPLQLHVKGSPFQLKVWEALLNIPSGGLTTYGQVAASIQHPNASRAVGTAIGSNPVAFLIPCHRVIRSDGQYGGYMWGSTRKSAIIGWEAAHAAAE